MLRVGLTGGLASGKSFVGLHLKALGCHVIKADELGHAVLAADGEAYAATVRAFGEGILDAAGAIDRRKLAGEVFGDPARLEKLNAIVHPQVRARAKRLAQELEAADPAGILVTEAAILVETGSYREYDRLIVAACTEEQQVERAMHRDGITREEVLVRLSRQLPLVEKLKFADYVIDTSGTKENTIIQTRSVYEALRSVQR